MLPSAVKCLPPQSSQLLAPRTALSSTESHSTAHSRSTSTPTTRAAALPHRAVEPPPTSHTDPALRQFTVGAQQSDITGSKGSTPLQAWLQRTATLATACCCAVTLTVLPAMDAYAFPQPQMIAEVANAPSTSQGPSIKADPRKVKALVETLGLHPHTVRAVIRTVPELLEADPRELSRRADSLQALLQLDKEGRAKLVLQAPRLLTKDVKRPREHLKQLQKLLGISEAAARQVAVQRPAVLLPSPNELKEHMAFLQAALELSDDGIRAAATSSPGLLLVTPATVSGRLEGLEASLGVGGDTAVALARRCPRLLLARMDNIEDRLKEISSTFQVPEDAARAWALAQPRLLTISTAAALQPTIQALADTLQVGPEAAAAAVRKSPALLLQPRESSGEAWKARWEELGQLLGISREAAKNVVMQEPELLTLSTEQLQGRLEAVANVFRLPADRAAALASQRPLLLTKSREDLLEVRRQITAQIARQIAKSRARSTAAGSQK